jgi:hypothetical protein
LTGSILAFGALNLEGGVPAALLVAAFFAAYTLAALISAIFFYLYAYLCYAACECILSWASKKIAEGFAPVR